MGVDMVVKVAIVEQNFQILPWGRNRGGGDY